MNKGTWEKLPDDLKEVFNNATGPDWWEEVGNIWTKNDDDVLKAIVENGNEYVELTQEETDAFEQALSPVVDHWIKQRSGEIDAKGLVDAAKAAIAKHSS